MHQHDWIEFLTQDEGAWDVMQRSYIMMFIEDTPMCVGGHDAMGLVLMGGEL